jgi:hypothetical protein
MAVFSDERLHERALRLINQGTLTNVLPHLFNADTQMMHVGRR